MITMQEIQGLGIFCFLVYVLYRSGVRLRHRKCARFVFYSAVIIPLLVCLLAGGPDSYITGAICSICLGCLVGLLTPDIDANLQPAVQNITRKHQLLNKNMIYAIITFIVIFASMMVLWVLC